MELCSLGAVELSFYTRVESFQEGYSATTVKTPQPNRKSDNLVEQSRFKLIFMEFIRKLRANFTAVDVRRKD